MNHPTPTPLDTAPNPDCHACHGTGSDAAFGGTCGECWRTPIAARWQVDRADQVNTDRPDRRSSTGTGSTPRQMPTPPANVEGDAEAELVDWLREQTWSEFATDLARFYGRRGYLTEKQHAAATRMRAKCEARRAAVRTTSETSTWDERGSVARVTRHADAPQVEPGYYATGEPDATRFYKVDHGTGRWDGYTFVSQVIGGQPDAPVKGNRAATVLAAIAEDPLEASTRYGREIGRCGVCNRTLTDPESRAAGIGPVCRQSFG